MSELPEIVDRTDSAHADLIWLLNQFRAAELRGASVILRLGRLSDTSELRSNFTRHLRDEGVHAWLWTRAIQELGGEVVDVEDPYQARLGAAFGLPRTVEELLAVTLVSEKRGVAAYREQLGRPDTPEPVRKALTAILKDETWHVEWIEEELLGRGQDRPEVVEALARAEEADRVAVEELERLAATR